jgi:hypothetical protein
MRFKILSLYFSVMKIQNLITLGMQYIATFTKEKSRYSIFCKQYFCIVCILYYLKNEKVIIVLINSCIVKM